MQFKIEGQKSGKVLLHIRVAVTTETEEYIIGGLLKTMLKAKYITPYEGFKYYEEGGLLWAVKVISGGAIPTFPEIDNYSMGLENHLAHTATDFIKNYRLFRVIEKGEK